MANGCLNAKLDEANYASAVYIIGMYIAAGSLLCLGLMLFDIISAWRQSSTWIPCRAFKLNSVTLTLLAVSSKLTVDLTTAMPGVQDQMSKLTGTIHICILMGFLNPSIGDSSGSESLSNIGALSIMVITTIVNICIQISTGVIYLFVVEHIIIMCIMLLLLFSMWACARDVHFWKERSLEFTKHFIKYGDTKGPGSLLKRLKVCYIHAFRSNPQVSVCLEATNVTTGGFCLVCFGVLIEAALRSIILEELKFCGGVSDYDWTIWIILFIQILTIIVGCVATTFRWFTLLYPGYYTSTRFCEKEFVIQSNPILGARTKDICFLYLTRLFGYLTHHLAKLFTIFSSFFFSPGFCTLRDYKNDKAVQDYTHLIGGANEEINLNHWTVWKAANDMNKWVEVSKSKPLKYLPNFLSKPRPFQLLNDMEIDAQLYRARDEVTEVSSLTIAILVRIARFSLPKHTKSLEDTFCEAYDIIDYVQTRINPTSAINREISKYTNALFIGKDFDVFLPKIIKKSKLGEKFHSLSELERARLILKYLKKAMKTDELSEEVRKITALIKRRRYQTINDLYENIEEMYVCMLHLFLAEFPNVVFKDVNESPAEEFEEKTRTALKLVCKLEPLESRIKWSFPPRAKIFSLINGTQTV